jgi:6-phosphofructokinase
VIAVSEGIHDESGATIAEKLSKTVERDAHGNVQLSGTGALADLLCDEIKDKLKIKRVRGDTFGYLQRSFLGCVSDVDQHEAREVGEKAVQYAMWGDTDGSVAIRRSGDYAVDYRAAAARGRGRQDAHDGGRADRAAGNDVTPAFFDYLRRCWARTCPRPHRLRAPAVAKVLKR